MVQKTNFAYSNKFKSYNKETRASEDVEDIKTVFINTITKDDGKSFKVVEIVFEDGRQVSGTLLTKRVSKED